MNFGLIEFITKEYKLDTILLLTSILIIEIRYIY